MYNFSSLDSSHEGEIPPRFPCPPHHTNLGLAEVGGGGGARLSCEDEDAEDSPSASPSSSSSGEDGDWLPGPPPTPISDAGEESAREAVPLLESFLGRRTG